jgi:sugar O-acyltransferase (sialic acid O-acetyltransferase NeuD family)
MKIIIIGNGGQARSCLDVINTIKKIKFSGFVSKLKEDGVIGSDNNLKEIRKKFNNAIIGVGQIKSPLLRKKIYKNLNDLNFNFPVIISPYSYVSKNSIINEGTIVMHNVSVNYGVNIGKHCIINTSSIIEHDVYVDDFCHISTGVILNGGVKIGNGSFIGSGTIIKENVKIGKNCVIGMGSVIKRNLPDNAIIR